MTAYLLSCTRIETLKKGERNYTLVSGKYEDEQWKLGRRIEEVEKNLPLMMQNIIWTGTNNCNRK